MICALRPMPRLVGSSQQWSPLLAATAVRPFSWWTALRCQHRQSRSVSVSTDSAATVNHHEHQEHQQQLQSSGDSDSGGGLSEQQRDMSRLSWLHRRRLHGLPISYNDLEAATAAPGGGGCGGEEAEPAAPFDPAATSANWGVPVDWRSVDRQRQLWARYGAASGVSPAICFPNEEERSDLTEYEALAEPEPLHVMVERDRQQRQQHATMMQQRMDRIAANMERVGQWKAEIADRLQRKIDEEQERRKKKQDMVEEVRETFGFNIDRRDPRFVDAMAAKEEKIKLESKAKRKLKRTERMKRMQAVALQDQAETAALSQPDSQDSETPPTDQTTPT